MTTSGRRRLVALIGDPVASSLSPAMHGAAFEAVRSPLEYRAMTVRTAELPDAFGELRRTAAGLNVTTPLKEAVLPLLDVVAPTARRAGSVNTVQFFDEGAVGHSTDGAGFLAALHGHVDETPARAVIIGTGGAARAVAAALVSLGVDVTVAGRNAESARRLVTDLGVTSTRAEPPALKEAVEPADLVVNATPLGGPAWRRVCPLPKSVPLRRGQVVFDLVYRPRRTPLVERADAAGCVIVEGVEMLVEQGARSFELWTNRRAPVDVMRRAASRALDEDPVAPRRPVIAAKERA